MTEANDWIEAIRKIVREEIKMSQKYDDNKLNSIKIWNGKVLTFDSGTNKATILLPNETVATTPKINATNQVLNINDEVLLFSPSGNLGDSFIFMVKKKYI